MGSSPPPPQPQPPVQVLPPPLKSRGMSTGCVVALLSGVVLVGIGVVVAIIAAIVIPAYHKLKETEKKRGVEVDMASVRVAVDAFKAEYKRVPVIPGPLAGLDGEERDTSDADGRLLLSILLGEDAQQNPKKIRFWTPANTSNGSGAGYSGKSGLIDRWGTNGYRFRLDDNNDGRIADPAKVAGDISAGIVLYSAGPDGDFSTWKDNVTSW
jgi:type II secretory pathway pseudopilin PulG